MYQLVETQDSRIAQYSFGKSISQYGMTVFSCNSARKGKKIFGNDPDPTTEIMVQTQDDIISAHIKDNPDGKVCLLYTSPSPRDATLSRMPSSA